MAPRVSLADLEKRAFISYHAPQGNGTGLKLAVKDNIDMRGVVTAAGSEYRAKNSRPATSDAPCLAIARERHVTIVGRTNMSEFAVSPSGLNDFFGTPPNPFDRRTQFIPGGSSSGSAVAVSSGLADVALGTDTAGSVRVPAACCGVVGLKTTYGLVSIKGIIPIEPKHLDTVGPLAPDIRRAAQGMDLLQRGFAGRYEAAVAAKPTGGSIRIGRLRLRGTDANVDKAVDAALAAAGFTVVPLDDDFREKWDRATKDGNAVAAGGAWLSDRKYSSKSGVSARTKAVLFIGRLLFPNSYRDAVAQLPEWQRTVDAVFRKVDFIALPTLQSTPFIILPGPNVGLTEARMLALQNTVAVNLAGNPALAVPIPLRHADVPVTSLQLIGPRRSEAALLNAGRIVEKAVRQRMGKYAHADETAAFAANDAR